MKIRLLTSSIGILFACLPLSAITFYMTEVTFDQQDLDGTLFDSAQILWSTDTSGSGSSSDLIDLSFYLYNGDSLIYTDDAISNGVAESIGGASRSLDDIEFTFDTNLGASLIVDFFNNDVDTVEFGGSSGETYNIFTHFEGGLRFYTEKYLDGVFKGSVILYEVEYSKSTSVVPEPGHYGLVLALLSLSAVYVWRKRAQHC
ncbi:PEP-CTERM sorting domain-containing protein [Cerasicoccus frondis]|uniref:PEP-CTERM sorting domain-containing protein n=1 Tax=Cerasicoccus frondis TaxID=490090 RepID=UPI0028526C93|nr:PEP-CTERM sorting domain-containing protein [Cerasicoccus frondis]